MNYGILRKRAVETVIDLFYGSLAVASSLIILAVFEWALSMIVMGTVNLF